MKKEIEFLLSLPRFVGFIFICFVLLYSGNIGYQSFKNTGAMTLPWGIVYFDEGTKNDPFAVAHEQCHYEKMIEDGWPTFYWNYFWDPCAEEVRCDANPETHPACTIDYFWVKEGCDR